MAQRVNIEVLNKAAVDVTVQNSNAINVEVPTAPRGLGAPFTANKTEILEGGVVDFTATNPGFEYLFSIEDVGGFINKTGKTISHQFLDSGNFDVALTQADLNQQASGIQIKRDFIKVNEVEFILNTFPGATAAYSLRKLERSVTKAVRVREDSGNTEADISFSGGALDETALLNHCGSANGFVTKWYDQSGNSNDASNSTASGQPQIVNSGSVIKENGKPALDFDGSDDNLFVSSIGTISGDVTAFLVLKQTNLQNNKVYLNAQSSPGNRTQIMNINQNYRLFTNQRGVTGTVKSGQQLLSSLFSGSDSEVFANGSSEGVVDPGTISSGDFELTIGSNQGGGAFLSGTFQEIVYYNSSKSSNRNKIETNINTFYSIF